MKSALVLHDRDFMDLVSGKVSSIDKFIGTQLRRQRQKRNMTLHDVSGILGVSYQQIQKYEQATSRVSASTLYKLTKLYEIDIGNFFKEVGAEALLYGKRRNILQGAQEYGINLLIVEANPADEVVTRNALKDIENLNILCVHDGAQALDVLKYKTLCPDFPRPNIVFLDIYIPKRDGFNVLKELRRDDGTKDIPIVIITNNISHELKTRAYKLGASGYILKSTDHMAFKKNIVDCIKYWTETVVAP